MLGFGRSFGPMIALASIVTAVPSVQACTVPVFRYALERWAPSPYTVILEQYGNLTPVQQQHWDFIRKAADRANFKCVELGGTSGKPSDSSPPDSQKPTKPPRILIRFPDSPAKAPSVFTIPVDADRFEALINSTVRTKLVDSLTDGTTAVLLMLRSADPVANEACRKSLEERIARAASTITLPKQSEEGPQVLSAIPLVIRFEIIEVDRTAEPSLSQLLLRCDDELDQVIGPIVFPVFGRGRVLAAIHGKELTGDVALPRALDFICKACSCQVKELNPGMDLLTTGRWERIFDVRRGPAPRVVLEESVPPVQKTPSNPAALTPPDRVIVRKQGDQLFVTESRSAPPDDFPTIEHRGSADRSGFGSPQSLRIGAIGAGIACVLCLIWAIRSRTPRTSA